MINPVCIVNGSIAAIVILILLRKPDTTLEQLGVVLAVLFGIGFAITLFIAFSRS